MMPTDVIRVNQNTATITITICDDSICACSSLNKDNTYIQIRRDGPVYRAPNGSCCGNPHVQIMDCPLVPGNFSFPLPTFIVPCNYPVAPMTDCSGQQTVQLYFKYPPFVKYPLFDKSSNQLIFYLDSLFYKAYAGRYIADLFVNDEYCGSQRLLLEKKCRISKVSTQRFNRRACDDMNPSPECC